MKRKLIRDKYIEIIEPNKLSHAKDSEKISLLKEKLREEIEELIESDFEDLNEYGDVLEVLQIIMDYKNIDFNDVNKVKESKKEDKGGFSDFLLLEIEEDNIQKNIKSELEEKLLFAQADMQNTIRREQREKEKAIAFSNEKFAKDLMLPLDTVDSALNTNVEVDNISFEDLKEIYKNTQIGLDFIKKKFNETFEKNNITLVDTDISFNPNIHEAMSFEKNEDFNNNDIIKVIQNGYMYNDRLLRPALVVICKNN